MAWFKVDDGFYSSRKVLSIPRGLRLECIGLWTVAGAWSSKEMTDGKVPEYVLEELGARTAVVKKLVEVGLWIERDKLYEFHDWRDYQPTKEEVLERRQKVSKSRAEAGRKGAAARWQNDGKAMAKKDLPYGKRDSSKISHKVDSNDLLTEHGKMAKPWQQDGKAMAPTRPVPTRKEAKASLGQKKASAIPSGWVPSEACVKYAAENGLNIKHEAEQFKAHAHANDRKQKNWDASFRLWLGNAVKWSKPTAKNVGVDDWMNK